MAVFRIIPPGDLALKNGSPYYIAGPAYIRQKLSVRFKFFQREWFLNQLEGIPYYRDVFVKNPNLDVVNSLFKRVIRTCPGVLGLRSYSSRFDAAERVLYFRFVAIVEGGEVIVAEKDRDFIVDVDRAA